MDTEQTKCKRIWLQLISTLGIYFLGFLVFLAVAIVLSISGYAERFGYDKYIAANGQSNSSSAFTQVLAGGSTFAGPLYIAAYSLFESMNQMDLFDFNYALVGSGAGRIGFFGNNYLFGGTDDDVSAAQVSANFLPDTNEPSSLYPTNVTNIGTFMFPMVLSYLGIAYNLPGSSAKLNFSGEMLGRIFAGNITNWNDTDIASLNPNINMPNASITVVVRGVSSGSTSVFTKYLASKYPPFATNPGTGGLPRWSSSFIKTPVAQNILVIVNSLPYSIGYASGDSIAAMIQQGYGSTVGYIMNGAGNLIYPSLDGAIVSAASMPSVNFNAHLYAPIADAPGSSSYPLSLFSFILIHQHYFWNNATGDINMCLPIQKMIRLLNFTYIDSNVEAMARTMGFTTNTDQYRTSVSTMLEAVTCNRVPVMAQLRTQDLLAEIVIDPVDIRVYESLRLIDSLNGVVANSPVGFMFSLVLAIGTFVIVNVGLVLATRAKHENKENKGEKKKEGKGEKTKEKKKKVRRSLQNTLTFISIILTYYQYSEMLWLRSKFLLNTTTIVKVLKIVAFHFSISIEMYIVASVLVAIWLLGLFYATVLRSIIVQNDLLDKTNVMFLDKQASIFMPNFVSILATPALYNLFLGLDCRLNSVGIISVLDPLSTLCFQKDHWAIATSSIFLTLPFAYGSIRYAYYWKLFKRKYDLKDIMWYVIFEPYVKVMLIIFSFYLPSVPFYALFLAFMMAHLFILVVKKPSAQRWFDVVRGCGYSLLIVSAIVFLVLEASVPAVEYNIIMTVQFCLSVYGAFLVALPVVMVGYIVIYRLDAGLSEAERAKLQHNIDSLFKDIATGDIHDLGSEFSLNGNIAVRGSAAIVRGSAVMGAASSEEDHSAPNSLPQPSSLNADSSSPASMNVRSSLAPPHGSTAARSSLSGGPIAATTPTRKSSIPGSNTAVNYSVTTASQNVLGSQMSVRGSTFNWSKLKVIVNKAIHAGLVERKIGNLIMDEINSKSPLVMHIYQRTKGSPKEFFAAFNRPMYLSCGPQVADILEEEEEEEEEEEVEENE